MIKLIFGLNIQKDIEVGDMTTILLRYCITKELNHLIKFEMGIGTGGLLSNFIAKKFKNKAYGVDISETRVKQSELVARLNNIKKILSVVIFLRKFLINMTTLFLTHLIFLLIYFFLNPMLLMIHPRS